MTRAGFISLLVELAALCLVIFTVGKAVEDRVDLAFKIGNWHSAEGDAGSEADAINSAMNYYLNGFSQNAGLPNRGHPLGKLYIDPNDKPHLTLVYTHYPPGPYWIVGLSEYIFGPGQIPLYRIVSISLCAICFVITYFLLRRILGPLLSALLISAVFAIPMTTKMMHSLFFHSYCMPFLILQVSFVFLKLQRQSRLTWPDSFFIFIASFFQGWMSFDYAFIASLYPLAIAAGWRSATSRWMMLVASWWAGIGFTTAHILHFLQVQAFHGSFQAAFGDLFDSARHRMEGEGPIMEALSRMDMLTKYLTDIIPRAGGADFYTWLVPSLVMLVVSILIIWGVATHTSTSINRGVAGLVALCTGFAISVAWTVIMKNHSAEAGHHIFLPRHYMLLMFTGFLFLAEELRHLIFRWRIFTWLSPLFTNKA